MFITNLWNDTPATGPATLSGNFTSNGGFVQIFFAGSAWTSAAPVQIGANLLIDGTVVTAAKVFTNESTSHRALVPSSLVIRLAAGTHTVAIATATPQTKIDTNDLFTLTLTELTFS
jgi:hypothetical protein